MREKIIQILKNRDGYVSGEEISSHLQISRQALWKHIQELRDIGYEIIAVPHLGYQLAASPDKLLPLEIAHKLRTRLIGKQIHYFDCVSSTMDIAWQKAMEGLPDGALVVAEAQHKGRGRFARQWVSPKYKGIYFSFVLRPKILPGESPLLTMLAAVGICEAIKAKTGLDPQIKWPNDILVHQKKVSGILTELNAEMDEVHFVVIGIGLNVNNDKKTLPAAATSLKEQAKTQINRVDLLQEILRRIEENYLVFQKGARQRIIEKWREYNLTLGRRVKIAYHHQQLEGLAVDLDKDGALLLRGDSGVIQRITAGDIIHCR
jgi:BirA family biotin operon repressor/biotin-[acetyl-CoA-carboxylase] ligase